jgi:hypothetical protein
MAYIGRQPAAAPLTSADITNGIIVNDDIAAGAAIEQTKLATLSITDSNIADGALAQAKISNLTTELGGKASLTADQTFTGGNRGTVTVANTASFDMDITNNFSCTPTANYTITFTNITAGQSGNIYINNGSAYTASKAASVKLGTADLTTLSATGEYWLSYFAPSASVVLVSVTAALS